LLKTFFIIFLLSLKLLAMEKTLNIATYNVDNLFDLKKSGNEYKEYIPYSKSNWNAKAYKTKLNHIARVIKDLNADIVALQEVESKYALIDLQRTLKQKDIYYNYYAIANRKNTTVKVALLSKYPFVYAKEVRVGYGVKYRNILEVKFKFLNQELYIFVNHWKSKNGPESQRLVYAKALKKRLNKLGYNKNIILLGDFNSDYEEYIKFKRKRRLNDTGGKTGINHIINTIDRSKKDYMYNLWYTVDKDKRYSYIYKRKKEALDNIIVSKPIMHKGGIEYIYNSISSFKPTYLFTKKGYINRWQITRRGKKHRLKGYSDHLPVSAKFKVKGR